MGELDELGKMRGEVGGVGFEFWFVKVGGSRVERDEMGLFEEKGVEV